MPAWPETLPNFLAAGYERAPGPSGERFQPDRGPAKQRLTTRAAPWQLSFQLKCTKAQRDAFWEFWRDDCKRGALSFTMTDPVEEDEASFSFLIDQAPRESFAKPYYMISFPMERLP